MQQAMIGTAGAVGERVRRAFQAVQGVLVKATPNGRPLVAHSQFERVWGGGDSASWRRMQAFSLASRRCRDWAPATGGGGKRKADDQGSRGSEGG